MSSPWSTAVLMRDGARNARRWQTYGARVGFSGFLMMMLLVGMWATVNVATNMLSTSTAELSWLGRTFYTVFTIFQTILALVMAPMMTARAIIEERTDETIELMVISPISIRSLLISKVISQVLVILLIILGGLPIMAMLLSLGGVGISEVVVFTVGIVVTVLLMGFLGAFFAMFTASPILATGASLLWALGLYIILPFVFGILASSYRGSAVFSPFFSNWGDWWGLLILVSYLPVIALLIELSARMFELRVSRAELRRYFSTDVWLGTSVLRLFLGFLFGSILWIPVTLGLSWWSSITLNWAAPTIALLMAEPAPMLLGGLGRAMALGWTMVLAVLSTWVYLRLGMDIVDALSGLSGGTGGVRSRKKKSVGHKIWRNPVLWRESRLSGWGATGVLLIVLWMLVTVGVFQTGVWIIPGGLLMLGTLNAGLAITLAIWIAAGSFEQERRSHTLTLLMMTTMSSWRIVLGKTVSVLGPSGPLLLFGGVLIVIGHPHLEMMDLGNSKIGLAIIRGFFVALWWIPVWICAVHTAHWIGLRLRRKTAVYTFSFVVVFTALGVPASIALVLRDLWFVAAPARMVSAGLMPWPNLLELVLSIILWGAIAVCLHVILTVNLRRWGGQADE